MTQAATSEQVWSAVLQLLIITQTPTHTYRQTDIHTERQTDQCNDKDYNVYKIINTHSSILQICRSAETPASFKRNISF